MVLMRVSRVGSSAAAAAAKRSCQWDRGSASGRKLGRYEVSLRGRLAVGGRVAEGLGRGPDPLAEKSVADCDSTTTSTWGCQ